MKRLWIAVLMLEAACLDVAERRAERDRVVGQAQQAQVAVAVQDGLAAVRGLDAPNVRLWAQAPELTITLTLTQTAPLISVTIENILFDAELFLDGASAPLPKPQSPVPTQATWQLTFLPAGAHTLKLTVPDSGSRLPFQFGAFADVQERLDDVQEIYARMNAEPNMRFVIMSGDLTRQGTPSELARFQAEMKSLRMPIYATLGNHELGTRDDLFHDYFGRGNFRFVFRGVQFTLLDSASATLAPVVYDWLDTWLAEGLQRTHFVFMHIAPIDPVGARNGSFASRLEAAKLLSRLAAGGVDMTVYGHVHSFYPFSNAGIPAYITGGGGAIPERFDGIGRHFMLVDVDPASGRWSAGIARVD